MKSDKKKVFTVSKSAALTQDPKFRSIEDIKRLLS